LPPRGFPMAKATGRKAPSTPKASASKKTAVVKKAAPAKAAAKKAAPARATKPPMKKAVSAKAATKKAAPAKSVAATAKKTVPTKKAVAKKAAPAKAVAKKAAPAKAVAKKAAPAKAVAKKAAPAKKAVAEPKVPVKKQPAGKTCALSGIFVPKQSPNITPKTLEKLRELLLEEREHHVRQAADLQADADALVNDREQGDTQFDEESGEGDTISVERERDLMLSATARLSVDEIDLALERMKAGTYGLCTPAGRRIPVARLEAIPWADTCVDCKQRVERRR